MSLALVLSLALAQAPADAAPVAQKPVSSGVEAAAPAPVVTETPKTEPAPIETPWWQKVKLDGYARVGLFYTFPLQDQQLVGSNGGFRVADFRLGLDFHPVEKFTVYTSVELAAPLVDPNDPLTGRRIVELRDAYAQYDVADFFQVRAGQFRPGYYAEMLMSDGALPFTARSILGEGLNPPEGYGPRIPLAPDRQIGVQFASKRLGGDTVGFKYLVGVFNGAGMNTLFNTNNSLMPVARVEVDVMKHVILGVNGYYAQTSAGVRPNRLTTTDIAYGADLQAVFGGFSAMAAFIGKQSSYSYGGLPSDSSMGVMGQLRYFHEATGLEIAGRFAFLEPSSAQSDDQVTETAAMVGWKPFGLPFRVLLQYTHRGEEARATYANDSVDAMLHAVW